MLFLIWDVETLLRFACAVSYRLGGWYEAEVEVFLAIPIVGYIRVYAGVGLKHVP
jgi:NADH:ubiquinone oxidoreductase subunit 3 (subunit A)